MTLCLRSLLLTTIAFLSVATLALATELPIATTVPLEGVSGLPGMVIRYDEAAAVYTVTSEPQDPNVYGVVGERPAIVFVTATSAAAVVTSGVTGVLVDAGANGPIVRGDVLTTSGTRGVAMRAPLETDAVFAVALEDAPGGQRLIRAEVNVEKAKAVQAAKQAAAAAGPSMTTTFARTAIAALLALGALGFLLYSFKTIANTSVVSIGRNPRARATVIATAAASFVAAVLLAILVVLIAIGVLVLPV